MVLDLASCLFCNVSKVMFQVYGPLTAGVHMQQERSVSSRSLHSRLIVLKCFELFLTCFDTQIL